MDCFRLFIKSYPTSFHLEYVLTYVMFCFLSLLLLYCFVFIPLDWFIHLHVKFSIICVILSMFLGCSFFIVWLQKETCRTEFKYIPIKFLLVFFIKFSSCLWIRSSLHPSFPFERLVVDSIFFRFKVSCLWNKLLII